MKKIKRQTRFIAAMLIMLFFVVTAPDTHSTDQVQNLEQDSKIVAKVNGSPIFKSELDLEQQSLITHLLGLGKAVPKKDEPMIRNRALESLINAEILYAASLKMGYGIEKEAIDKEILKVKKQFQNTNDYENMLKSIGFSENQLRNHFEKGLAVKKIVEQKFEKNIVVEEKDILEYYKNNPEKFNRQEEVQASHILIKLDADANPAQKINAKKEIEKILRQINEGKDFATLAKALSQCPSSSEGGDLGFFKRGVMEKSFEDAAFALKPGQISGIISTSFGYHIIHVTGKKTGSTISLEDSAKRIKTHLTLHRSKALMNEFIKQQRLETKTEKIPESL
ncbi:peptidylprolyl isomerase [Desulfobacula phenolica]|uniref:peptidylprolyl isomerase n=1 Tax=Desulfobacula phenolica TaxID=90732 RepID=A0A1H2DMY9_9BACT|nr:peptidylprolyl isomerase [Desulfobacula phenolica]SDT84260.1 peptidyl-prolyl cis-trans isomerase C [Desulfobacula phenolica]